VQFIYYDATDGLYNKMYVENMGWQELEFASGFAYKDYKNFLYFGGVGGIVMFHPDSLPVNPYRPPVVVQNFFVNGKKMPFSGKPIPLKNQQNHIKFNLSVYNYIQPEKNQYAYKLVPYDTSWHYAGHKNTAEYYNLPPGKYTFYYKGSNNDGIWSPVYRFPALFIANPFYKTTGFYLANLILIFLLLLAFLAYRFYLKRKLARQKKKLRYQTSNLKEEDAKRISKKLEEKLRSEKLYLEPDLSLHKLAESIGEKAHHVSQVINQLHNKRFGDYINTFRIEEAKKMLVETYLKIEAVAYDSGFSSLSTFNAVFKKETGLTPSKYRKIHRQND